MKGLTSLGKVTVAACIRSCVATAALCLGAAHAGAVTVESNTKLSGDTDWTGQGAVTIAADATLDLNGCKLSVDGLAGTGTITDSVALGESIIPNGDFEAATFPSDKTWGYVDSAACPNWTGHLGGFTKANTPWTGDVKGNVSAFVQTTGNLSESVTVSEAGDYVLTYSYKNRPDYPSHELNVVVDTQVCGKTDSAATWAVNTIVLHLSAGKHVIEFAGVTTVDSATILDDVSLRKIPGELHVVVPEGRTADVSSVRLGGAFRLVAEGAGTCLLHADCDWRGLGGLTVAGKIDLNGHELRIADLEGSGEIADDSFDLTDPSQAGERATISSVTGGTAMNLFKDNFARNGTDNDYRVIAQEQKLPLVCTYDFEAATVIDAYGIAVGPISDYMKRMPYSWKVEGSLDESTWVTLDTRTGEQWWAAHDYRRFTFENATGYRYYRLTVSDSQGTAENSSAAGDLYLELVQIEYGRKGADGVLRLDVPEGKTMENAGVSFKGNFKLVKEGAGTFKASVAKQLNLLGTEVREGKLVFGVAQDPLGLGTVKVAAGATIDMNGLYDVNTCYNYETAGTITQNFSAWTPNAKSFGSVTLTGDATFKGGNYALDAVGAAPGPLNLNGYTLRIESGNLIGISPRPVSGPGTVEIVRGRFQIDGDGFDLSSANLSVGEDGVLKVVKAVKVKDFAYSGTTWQNDRYDSVRVQVLGTFRPGEVYPALKMDGGSVVDLSGVTGVWNAGGKEPVGDKSGKKEYTEAGSVLFTPEDSSEPITITVAGRTLEKGEQLVRWGAVPAAGVKFVFDDVTAQSGLEPVVTGAGLFYGLDADVAATAVWTGAAEDGDVCNRGNWASTNFAGEAISALPCEQTAVTFAGDMNLQILTARGLAAAKVNFASCRLTADCDWRGLDTVDTAGEIVLDGHKLTVSKLNGTACISGGDYEFLEYIEAPGPTDGNAASASKSQWINTEFVPGCNDRIEMGANFRAKWNHTLWCARKNTSDPPYSFTAFLLNNNSFRFDRYKAPGTYLALQGQQDLDYTFVADGSARQVWINGTAQNPPWEDVSSFTVGGPLVLFCSYSDSANIAGSLGNPGRYRLYYLRVYGSDGALKRNFVPVRRYSDGKLGVLDRVTGGFYANAGQGQFQPGPVIGPESMGEVCVDVPENESTVNDGVVIRGAARLVKDGLGVYQPNVAQSYNGGTTVNAGTLKFGTNDHPAGEVLSTITVMKDATLDMNDKYSTSTCIYNYELAGTIVQLSSAQGSYADANRCFGPSFTLLDDATVRGDRYNFGTPSADHITFKMNGHALTLETVNYSGVGAWRASDWGTFVFKGGPFEWLKGQGPTNAAVIVEASASFKLGSGGDFDVGDFRYCAGEWIKTDGRKVLINVYGRYFADAYRPPIVLKDGSTLDLNDYDSATKGVFSFDGGGRECASGAIGGVIPESGATITVDVSKRLSGENRIRGDKMIATWTERPEDVNFVLDGESLAAGFELLVEDGGLRLTHKGFLILVK